MKETMKRRHQKDFEFAIDAIISGRSSTRRILCPVTPGGGKSTLPIIAGRLIKAGLADKLCWICPRTALQDQGARAFVDPFFRKLFDHKLTIRTSTNEPNPCRGTDGFITTYQAIGVDERGTVLREIKSRRYIVILDEFHHVEAGGQWEKSLQPIIDAAAYVVFMTGTLERGDDKKVAFLEYRDLGRGVFAPALDRDTVQVRYTRADALAERAIIPLAFCTLDGHAKWQDKDGRTHAVKSLAKTYGDYASAAIYTALETDFALQLTDTALEHYREYRRSRPSARMLAVCAGIESARRIADHLYSKGINARIATSHESADAHKNIKAFKSGSIDVLVTIAMAYEGLDVPAISHIACLTHIRSKPWIEQMVARAVRIDRAAGPYDTQRAYVFAPDDVLMREIIDQIKNEQAVYARSCPQQQSIPFEPFFEGDEPGGSGPRPQIVPLGSGVIGMSEAFLNHDAPPEPTPDDIEQQLRDNIEQHIRAYAWQNRHKPQSLNAQVYKQFGKPRNEMTADELKDAYRWIKRRWPENHRRGTGITRTPAKAVAWS